MRRAVLPLLLMVLAGARPSLADEPGRLGRIDFPTSGAAAAQAPFRDGVLLLHSFEYEDAADAFRAAQKLDPGFALAYWGEAMTYVHPVWHEEDLAAGRAALARLGATPEERAAKAPTAREKGYLQAVEILYGDGDKASRDRAYADAMRRLHAAFPDDLEAASFYALALLGSCEHGRDVPTYMRAAAVAEEVFAKNPLHPGAVHYLIHSYDDPVHGPLGLRPARVYAQIAPAAAHALHMPSHIFLALGMWDDVAASNEASWAAADARRVAKQLGLEARGYHAIYWLDYTYLQQGRYRDAAKQLAIVEADVQASHGSRRIRNHLAGMRAAHLVETRQWKDAAAWPALKTDDLDVDTAAGLTFATGWAALAAGDRATAQAKLTQLEARKALPAAAVESHHGGYGGDAVTPHASSILAAELTALLEEADGKSDAAIARLEKAAAAEDAMSFEFGPPLVVKPTHELLGEVLLAKGRPQDAQKQFEQSLARAPQRALSLLGLSRAAKAAGDAAAARQAAADLRTVWHRADAELPELAELAQVGIDP